MSETIKAVEATKRVTDQTTRANQANIDNTAKATKEFASEAGHIAQTGADRTRETVQSTTEAGAETARVATDMSGKAVEQGREVLTTGVHAAASIGSEVADAGIGRGYHLLASAVQAMDIYREASDRSADKVRALFSSYMTFGRGLQHAWLEMVDHTMKQATHKPQDLLRCKNIVELAEVQRDLYVDAINQAFESTSRLLDLAGRTAQDAVRPLQTHTH